MLFELAEYKQLTMARKKKIIYIACKKKRTRTRRRKHGAGKLKRKYKRRRPAKLNFFGSGEQNTESKSKSGKPAKSRHLAKTLFKKQLSLLKVMRDLPVDQQIVLLHHLDSRACKDINKCINNVLSGKYRSTEINNNLRSKLLPYKDLLRNLSADSRNTKQLIPQIGGGLSLLLSTGIPILIDIARRKKWI